MQMEEMGCWVQSARLEACSRVAVHASSGALVCTQFRGVASMTSAIPPNENQRQSWLHTPVIPPSEALQVRVRRRNPTPTLEQD